MSKTRNRTGWLASFPVNGSKVFSARISEALKSAAVSACRDNGTGWDCYDVDAKRDPFQKLADAGHLSLV